MTAYAIVLEGLASRLTKMFGLWPRAGDDEVPGGDGSAYVELLPADVAIADFFLAPVVESLPLIGLIELMRRLRASVDVQIVVSLFLICGLHSLNVPIWGFIVAPGFFVGIASYIYWRRSSFWAGAQMMILLHFSCDLLLLLRELHRAFG